MARKPTLREQIADLLDHFEPIIAEAFRAAIDDIASQARIADIVALLERGDVDGAIRAIGLDPVAFRSFESAIRAAFEAGGGATVGSMPVLRSPDATRLVLRFDARNARAEQWLTQHSSELITRIVDDQRNAVRLALTEGMAQGRNPRNVALDIVGRINRVTGRREGGALGLTQTQERYAAKALEELRSGDRAALQNYLTRVRRDKRFDRHVLKAIEDGKPIASDTASRMVGRYKDSLLQLRGETIARTEAIASLNQSQVEAYRQAIDTGTVRPQDVRKVWVATKDKRTRDSHRELDGESVGINERFSNGLDYPCDPAGPVEEVANCRCTMLTRVDHLANLE